MTVLTGLSAFPITPASPGGEVDAAALRRLIAPLCAAGVDSIGVLGSTGSYPYLSRAERRRALEAALDEIDGRTPVLVGVGALRTDEAIALARDAKAAGASAGLLAPMSYTPLNDEEVFEHFVAVAEQGGLPLCIYDNPAVTHFQLSAALTGRLSRIDGVIALKASAPEAPAVAAHLAELRRLTPDGFSLGYSGDGRAVEALLAGGDAWYSVAAGLFPGLCVDLLQAVRRGDAVEARRLNERLEPLWALLRDFSGLRVIYACADLLGVCRLEPPRPILPLSGAARLRVAETLRMLDLS